MQLIFTHESKYQLAKDYSKSVSNTVNYHVDVFVSMFSISIHFTIYFLLKSKLLAIFTGYQEVNHQIC